MARVKKTKTEAEILEEMELKQKEFTLKLKETRNKYNQKIAETFLKTLKVSTLTVSQLEKIERMLEKYADYILEENQEHKINSNQTAIAE